MISSWFKTWSQFWHLAVQCSTIFFDAKYSILRRESSFVKDGFVLVTLRRFFFKFCVNALLWYKIQNSNRVCAAGRLTRLVCIIAEISGHVKGGWFLSRAFYPWYEPGFLLFGQSVSEENFKLRVDFSPVSSSSCPFSCNIYLCKIKHFQQCIIVRKYGLLLVTFLSCRLKFSMEFVV